MDRKKVITLFGSTGSIGRATLEIVAHQKESFQVSGLACGENIDLLNRQIEQFRPEYVCIFNGNRKDEVRFDKSKILTGVEGMKEMAAMPGDMVVNALPGSIGLEPTIETLRTGKILALANKESLVMAGRIIKGLLKDAPERLIPVDSEHSAVHQLLQAVPRRELKTITITASGGPFRNRSKEDLMKVRPEEALKHPTWNMGRKITLDSATLMNKGLEVIEARWLFDLEPERIRVLVHPESIIHGIIELADNSLLAYMSWPDMKVPIAYALNGSVRHEIPVKGLDLAHISTLSFHAPDLDRFPSLKLAYDALAAGDSALVTLNTANEVLSDAFFAGKIGFMDIPRIAGEVLAHHRQQAVIENLDDLWYIHGEAGTYTKHLVNKALL